MLAVALFFSYRHQLTHTSPEPPEGPEQTAADLSIRNFSHTAQKDGRTQWILEAGTARYFKNKSRARLKRVNLTFFPESDQPETHLTADKGRIELASHDMHISGRVVVENRRWRLETEALHYRHDSNIIFTEELVHIWGEAIQLRADAMEFNLNTGKLVCRGHVEGTLIGADAFKPKKE